MYFVHHKERIKYSMCNVCCEIYHKHFLFRLLMQCDGRCYYEKTIDSDKVCL